MQFNFTVVKQFDAKYACLKNETVSEILQQVVKSNTIQNFEFYFILLLFEQHIQILLKNLNVFNIFLGTFYAIKDIFCPYLAIENN